jgi:hypothetical protein
LTYIDDSLKSMTGHACGGIVLARRSHSLKLGGPPRERKAKTGFFFSRKRSRPSCRRPIFGSDYRTSVRCVIMPRRCDVLHCRDPLQLCQFLLSQFLSRNVRVHHPVIVTDIITKPDNTITGLTIRSPAGSTTMLPCGALLLTAGVWTPRVIKRFSHMQPSRFRLHISLAALSSYARCIGQHQSQGCLRQQAVTPYSPAIPIPEFALEVQREPASIEVLMRAARKLLRVGDDEVEVLGTGFCHRPVSRSGAPLQD